MQTSVDNRLDEKLLTSTKGSKKRSWILSVPIKKIAVILSKLFAIISVILVIIWADSGEIDRGYLGGIDWNENVFSYHAIFMIIGVVYCTGWSLTAFKLNFLRHSIKRKLHMTFHLISKICLIVGAKAAYDYKQLTHADDDSGPLVHLITFHSWIGLATILLLVQNDTLGSITFFVPSITVKYAKIYKPIHKFLGISAYAMAMIAVVTGKRNLSLKVIPPMVF